MAHKTLVNGTVYEISGGKALVGGTEFEIAKGRTMAGGTGYDVSFDTPVGKLSVGSSVYLTENGTAAEYLVVHQGLPSAMYDESCNGTWLLRKDIYDTQAWHSVNLNNYGSSTIHSTYLNGTFLDLFDTGIRDLIKTVKIPFVNGTQYGPVASGADGLTTKIFLLSGYEVGWTSTQSDDMPVDGDCLSYFNGMTVYDGRRIGYQNEVATSWWLRSLSRYNRQLVFCVYYDGRYIQSNASVMYGIRPALVLPATAKVAEDGTVIA